VPAENPTQRSLRVEAIRLRDMADALELRLESGEEEAFDPLQVFALHRTAGRIDALLTELAAVENVQRKVIPLFRTTPTPTERTPR